MRVIHKILLKYDELNDKAKEKAREWFREGNDYPWFDEYRDSLKGFEKYLPIKIKDYSYGEERYRSYVDYDITDENVKGLKGLRLRSWFINNFWNQLEKGKYLSSGGVGGENYKSRRSTMVKEVSCPFTGYCGDEDLLDPIREFLFKFNTYHHSEKTFGDIIDACFESFITAVANDIEYQNSDEQVEESIRANEYEFDENGGIA